MVNLLVPLFLLLSRLALRLESTTFLAVFTGGGGGGGGGVGFSILGFEHIVIWGLIGFRFVVYIYLVKSEQPHVALNNKQEPLELQCD